MREEEDQSQLQLRQLNEEVLPYRGGGRAGGEAGAVRKRMDVWARVCANCGRGCGGLNCEQDVRAVQVKRAEDEAKRARADAHRLRHDAANDVRVHTIESKENKKTQRIPLARSRDSCL